MPNGVEDEPGQHDLARADLVGEETADRHREHRAEALRCDQPAGAQRRLAADLLEVQREQQAGAEEGHREQRHRDHRDGDVPVREQPQRDQRMDVALRRSAHQTNVATRTRPITDVTTTLAVNIVPCCCFAAGIDDTPYSSQREAGREQQHADEVEALGRVHLVAVEHEVGVDRGADTDRDVDQEDPVPRCDVDEPATEDRAEDRAEQHRHAEDRHHAAEPFRAGGPGQDRHAERHQHAAAETLHHAEGHEHLEALRGRAQRRTRR